MKGYKGFDQNLQCRGFQFEVGKEYRHEGGIELCRAGFHFCEKLFDVDCFYTLKNNRVCEVEAIGEVKIQWTKAVTNRIRIIRELSKEELKCLTDNFNFNTGNCNTGNCNTGNYNTGNYNTGDFNAGDFNAGNWNTGNWNTGHFNTGSWDEFRLFDLKAKRSEWYNAHKPMFIYSVNPATHNGNMKAAWAQAYANASDKDLMLLVALPKFSHKVFTEITGIDVRPRLKLIRGVRNEETM